MQQVSEGQLPLSSAPLSLPLSLSPSASLPHPHSDFLSRDSYTHVESLQWKFKITQLHWLKRLKIAQLHWLKS